MKNITGVGEADHVTANDMRNMLVGIFGAGSYILNVGEKLAPTLVSNNQLDIGIGTMCHHGNLSGEEKGASVAITNGTQGMKRIDLIVNRYQRNEESQVESNSWVYIMGTPDASNPAVPSCVAGNPLDGDLIDDCPVFKVTLNGLNVESVECLLPIVKPLADIITELSKKQSQITGGTAAPSGGEDGDVYIQFVE